MKASRLLAPPDDVQIEAGARGEATIARIRLWLVLLLTPIPLLSAIDNQHWENLVGAAVLVVALFLAVDIYAAVRRDPRRPEIGPVSTVADVSLITLGLATFLVYDEPLTATNSMVVFDAYFLAIAATALRHDPRLSIVAGALAVLQYAVIVGIAVSGFDLLHEGVYSERYGSFSWGTQVSRIILLTVASAVATIVVLRQDEMLHRSSLDSLTQLYNRAAFAERLETEAVRSRRHRHPLSVAMIDIDHFKLINDGYGHAAGDAALMQFADAMRTEFRTTDLLARYGGEEFVVMMPETAPEGAVAKLDRFVRHIAERNFIVGRRAHSITLTVSAGVAGVPADAEDPVKLVGLADERLIVAKRAGRNRVVGPGAEHPEIG